MKHTEVVGDQVQSLRVVLDLRVQSSQVEAVQDVFLVYLAKVFVALGAQEPIDPVLGVVRVRSACVIIHYRTEERRDRRKYKERNLLE
jgi:hypothetical protein